MPIQVADIVVATESRPRKMLRWVRIGLWGVAAIALSVALVADWLQSRSMQALAPSTAADAPAPAPRSPAPAPTHRVVVQVENDAGEPVRGARVYAPRPDEPAVQAEEFEPGRHLFTALEGGEVRLVVDLAGDRRQLLHPTQVPLARVSVPTGGRVAVSWALPERLDLTQGRLVVAFEPSASSTSRFEVPVKLREGEASGALLVPYLRPGAYLAQLEYWQEAAQPGETAVVLPLTSPLELAVRPDELTRIALGLPRE